MSKFTLKLKVYAQKLGTIANPEKKKIKNCLLRRLKWLAMTFKSKRKTDPENKKLKPGQNLKQEVLKIILRSMSGGGCY